MYKRQHLNPLVASIIGTLWIVIVIAGYVTLGVLLDSGTGAWWAGGIFLMGGLSAAPFVIYSVVNDA